MNTLGEISLKASIENIKPRFIGLLLSVALVVGIVPGTLLAAHAAPADDFQAALSVFGKMRQYLPLDGNAYNVTSSVSGETPSAKNDVGYANGKYGQALRLAAKNHGVDLGNLDYPANYSFTVSMWMRLPVMPQSDPAFYGNKNWGSGGNPGFVFSVHQDGNVRFNVNAGGVGRADTDWTSFGLADKQWHLLTAVVDRQNGVLSMYSDGKKVIDNFDISKFAGQSFNSTLPTYLGNDGTGNYADAKQDEEHPFLLDDFFLFDSALTDDEVATLYSSSDYLPRFYFENAEVNIDVEDSLDLNIGNVKADTDKGSFTLSEPYISSDTSLVTVTGSTPADATVTANNANLSGTATVTGSAVWKLGGASDPMFSFVSSIKVNVNEDDGRIFRKTDEVTITAGQNIDIPVKAPYKNNPQVTYLSNSPTIAGINTATGKIEAHAQGTAVITVSKAGIADDTLIVRVTDLSSPEQFALNKEYDGVIFPVATTPYTAGAQINTTAGGSVTWSSSDNAVATVDNGGVFRAVGAGTARITAKAALSNGSYLEDYFSIIVRADQIPINARLVGANHATVDTPFQVNVHFDSGSDRIAFSSLGGVIKYDPNVLEFVPDFRGKSGVYTDDPLTGTLTATWPGRVSANIASNDTSVSRLDKIFFKLKKDAPASTIETSIAIDSFDSVSEKAHPSVYAKNLTNLKIQTSFTTADDLNGDGLISIGDVAKAATADEKSSIAKRTDLGFYPVKRIVYLGVDGGGNFMAPDSWYTADDTNFAKGNKPEKYKINLFEGAGGLADTGSYTADAWTADPPISGQNWTAMLRGYHPSDSSAFTITNGDADSKFYPVDSPFESIFSILRTAQPNRWQGSYIEWGSMENGIVDNNLGLYQYLNGAANAPLNKAVEMINDGKAKDASFLFVDTDWYMDHVGHTYKWYNNTYYDYALEFEPVVKSLVDAIFTNEDLKDDTVFMMGNDHGGSDTGHGNYAKMPEREIMMYSRGPIIKEGYRYDTNGTAEQKDWASLFAKAMNVTPSTAWAGSTQVHDIFLTQKEIKDAKHRAVETVSFVKKQDGFTVQLSDIQSENINKINAAHIVLTGNVNADHLVELKGISIANAYTKKGELHVIVTSDQALPAGDLIYIQNAGSNIDIENVMLAKIDGKEIYPDLTNKNDLGSSLDQSKVKGNGEDQSKDNDPNLKPPPTGQTPGVEALSIKTAKVAAISSRVYSGKPVTPSVSVVLGDTRLKAGTDYTVAYASNTAIGNAKVIVTGKGEYTDSVTTTFKITPTKVKIKTAKGSLGKKTVTLKWALAKGGITKQALQYRVKGAKSWNTVSLSAKAKSKVVKIKKLKKGSKYQFRVRSYKLVGAGKFYSPWSSVKSVAIKK